MFFDIAKHRVLSSLQLSEYLLKSCGGSGAHREATTRELAVGASISELIRSQLHKRILQALIFFSRLGRDLFNVVLRVVPDSDSVRDAAYIPLIWLRLVHRLDDYSPSLSSPPPCRITTARLRSRVRSPIRTSMSLYSTSRISLHSCETRILRLRFRRARRSGRTSLGMGRTGRCRVRSSSSTSRRVSVLL